MLKLGQYVRDGLTGYKGHITARSEYLNGCVRFGVESMKDGDNTVQIEWFDEGRLDPDKGVADYVTGERRAYAAPGDVVRVPTGGPGAVAPRRDPK